MRRTCTTCPSAPWMTSFLARCIPGSIARIGEMLVRAMLSALPFDENKEESLLKAHRRSFQEAKKEPCAHSCERAHSAPRRQSTEIADAFRQALGDIHGGRVLDVATGEGGFVELLVGNLRSYTEIIGIDIDGRAIETARSAFDQEDIQFIQMDAERVTFEARALTRRTSLPHCTTWRTSHRSLPR